MVPCCSSTGAHASLVGKHRQAPSSGIIMQQRGGARTGLRQTGQLGTLHRTYTTTTVVSPQVLLTHAGRKLCTSVACPAWLGDPFDSSVNSTSKVGTAGGSAKGKSSSSTTGSTPGSTGISPSRTSGPVRISIGSSDIRQALTRPYRNVMVFVVWGALLAAALFAWAMGSIYKKIFPYSISVTFPQAAGIRQNVPVRQVDWCDDDHCS